MNEKQQDEMWIEVLEWMGWTIPDHCSHKNKSKGAPAPFGKRPGTKNDWTSLPPLTLDALHEAELRLDEVQQTAYLIELDKEAYGGPTQIKALYRICATKSQRLLALWRTIKP